MSLLLAALLAGVPAPVRSVATVDEGRRVLDLVRNMRDRGVSVIVISHNLEHVFQLADRIAVMKNGQLVGIVETASTTREAVVRMITFGQLH